MSLVKLHHRSHSHYLWFTVYDSFFHVSGISFDQIHQKRIRTERKCHVLLSKWSKEEKKMFLTWLFISRTLHWLGKFAEDEFSSWLRRALQRTGRGILPGISLGFYSRKRIAVHLQWKITAAGDDWHKSSQMKALQWYVHTQCQLSGEI